MITIKENFFIAEWDQMRSFLSECYRPDHILCYKKFFEWQFQVEQNDGKASLLCAWEGSRLAGILGYLPLLTHWGDLDNPVKGIWLLYWMIRKDAPRGLGWLLTKRVQNLSSLLMTVNASKMGTPVLRALGWSYFGRVPRYICVLDRKQCVAMLSPQAKEIDLDAMAFDGGHNTFYNPEVVLNKDTYNPDWKLYPGLAFGTVRSLNYFQWRYLSHPVFDYRIVIRGEAKRPVVCVYRIEEAFGSCEACVGRIVDFFHPGDEQGKKEGTALMRDVLQLLKEFGCAYVDFICSNKVYSQAITRLRGKEESADKQVLPVRLAPIEQVLRHQNFAFLASQSSHGPEMGNFQITKSDIDGDHPVSIPAHKNHTAFDFQKAV